MTVTVNTVTMNTEALADQLLTHLRSVTGSPALSYSRPPVPLTGGFWAELLAFSLAEPPPGWPHDLVARLMPEPFTARKEIVIQSGVAAAGFPTPAVRAAGGADDGLGRAFMIMDRAPGSMLLSGLTGAGALAQGRAFFGAIPRLLASTMARLHALDPGPIRSELDSADDVISSVGGMLRVFRQLAVDNERPDLAEAAQWLIDHPARPAPEVICHGDLHPFNLLADGDRITLLDWSSALIAPRSFDVAFTSLLLSEAPLRVPGWTRPAVRWLGRRVAGRFVRSYQRSAGVTVDPADVRRHQAVICVRALIEVSGWVHAGELAAHPGHPWLAVGPTFAARISAITGVRVRAQ
jgi:aminoglycoside phosphotransferase (APT) family kinase protein